MKGGRVFCQAETTGAWKRKRAPNGCLRREVSRGVEEGKRLGKGEFL